MAALTEPAVPVGRLGGQPQPTLTGNGLTVRPFDPADADVIVRAYSDPDVQRWHVMTMTGDEARSWIVKMQERWTAETGANWLVTDIDGTPLGRIGLNNVELWQGQAELAYWVLPDARGRGVAPRAIDVLCGHLFGHVGLHRIVLRHSVQNAASCRVAEKAGFALEGVLRDDGWHADGFHDMHLHARISG